MASGGLLGTMNSALLCFPFMVGKHKKDGVSGGKSGYQSEVLGLGTHRGKINFEFVFGL